MNRFNLFLLLCLGCGTAAAQLSCDDLTDVAGGLDDLYVALGDVTEIAEDSELDQLLDEVIGAMEVIAEVEDDQRLYESVDLMRRGWNDYDLDLLEAGMARATHEVDGLYERDCE